MVSNVLLRSSGHLNPRFLVILAMAVVALTAVGCGGNVSTVLGPSMGTVQVSISNPPSCMPPMTISCTCSSQCDRCRRIPV